MDNPPRSSVQGGPAGQASASASASGGSTSRRTQAAAAQSHPTPTAAAPATTSTQTIASSTAATLGDGSDMAYMYAPMHQITRQRQNIEYQLTIREQPKHSRMCGIGEKADRRPVDPAPIVQLRVITHDHPVSNVETDVNPASLQHLSTASSSSSSSTAPAVASASTITTAGTSASAMLRRGVAVTTQYGQGWEDKAWYLDNPYYFMYAMLADCDTDEDLHLLPDGKTRYTTGSCVSCLYHLKDIDGSHQGFFVFPDLSVRVEGRYKLKLCLFETIGHGVHHCKSIYSDPFNVYTAKRFPGMEESTKLSRSFADQGLKVRVRKNPRSRKSKRASDESDGGGGGGGGAGGSGPGRGDGGGPDEDRFGPGGQGAAKRIRSDDYYASSSAAGLQGSMPSMASVMANPYSAGGPAPLPYVGAGSAARHPAFPPGYQDSALPPRGGAFSPNPGSHGRFGSNEPLAAEYRAAGPPPPARYYDRPPGAAVGPPPPGAPGQAGGMPPPPAGMGRPPTMSMSMYPATEDPRYRTHSASGTLQQTRFNDPAGLPPSAGGTTGGYRYGSAQAPPTAAMGGFSSQLASQGVYQQAPAYTSPHLDQSRAFMRSPATMSEYDASRTSNTVSAGPASASASGPRSATSATSAAATPFQYPPTADPRGSTYRSPVVSHLQRFESQQSYPGSRPGSQPRDIPYLPHPSAGSAGAAGAAAGAGPETALRTLADRAVASGTSAGSYGPPSSRQALFDRPTLPPLHSLSSNMPTPPGTGNPQSYRYNAGDQASQQQSFEPSPPQPARYADEAYYRRSMPQVPAGLAPPPSAAGQGLPPGQGHRVGQHPPLPPGSAGAYMPPEYEQQRRNDPSSFPPSSDRTYR